MDCTGTFVCSCCFGDVCGVSISPVRQRSLCLLLAQLAAAVPVPTDLDEMIVGIMLGLVA